MIQLKGDYPDFPWKLEFDQNRLSEPRYRSARDILVIELQIFAAIAANTDGLSLLLK